MLETNTAIRPLTEEDDRILERLRSNDALPEEELAEKLRAEVRDFESRILAITGASAVGCGDGGDKFSRDLRPRWGTPDLGKVGRVLRRGPAGGDRLL